MATLAPPDGQPVAPGLDTGISRVPYLPGLDGMRALAVVAVMVYHANTAWLPGGFLGVEMFFVISGYLITLLLVAECERTSRISLRDFWVRRARRLLPAVTTMMALVVVWTAAFERAALGQLRGDVFAGTFYVSNWYQIWTGLGYTASGDFAPLRHLWSLAVEEQFYLVWPLVMALLLARSGTRRVAGVARWLFLAAVAVTVVVALLYYGGPISDPDITPDAYWWIGDRPISKIDTLYLSTVTRAGGLLLGAAFALVWRPYAVARGPLRTKGRWFDAMALVGMTVFAWMCWNVYLASPAGADSLLFQGGFFVCGIASLMVIAGVTHRGGITDRVLGNSVMRWVGTRSYGLYLYHWPIYQIIRGVAGRPLTLREFVMAMTITVALTELSFRLIERPVRRRTFIADTRRTIKRLSPGVRTTLISVSIIAFAVLLFAIASLVAAPVKQNAIAAEFEENEDFVIDFGGPDAGASPDPGADELPVSTTPVATVPGTTAPSTTAVPATTVTPATTQPPDARAGAPPVSADVPTDTSNATPTTVPPTTTPSTTVPPTTVPAAPVRQLGVVGSIDALQQLEIQPNTGGFPLIALGDSVMLGAAEELDALGFRVDAAVSRQMKAFLPTMSLMRDNATYGSVVVVHLGTNGGFSQATLDEMLGYMADVPTVILLTGRAPRGWIAGNNEMIRSVPFRFPNVSVIDWEAISGECPGNCFYDDDIHLRPDGQNFYASILGRVLGLG
ncbi:MAG: acyltransferase family protein [Actinomycetota bacterium]